ERENLVNHIHLPLQAGSDRILKLMNRNYTSEEYLRKINYIRTKIPDCAITTDIIVGFPGEEKEDFQKTLEIVKRVRFNRAFTFIYSPRKGTRASMMADYVSREEKEAWFKELVSVQNEISYEENKKLVGRRVKVLVEGESSKDSTMLEGRLESNIIVNFRGEKNLIGKFVEVKITEAKSFYLLGNL
ncbi:MAG: TRAM domain-containing protein, partial [Actinobacteria bacterium]|nr:TRAM domain-containing protein [Actinomycetota bacterium]